MRDFLSISLSNSAKFIHSTENFCNFVFGNHEIRFFVWIYNYLIFTCKDTKTISDYQLFFTTFLSRTDVDTNRCKEQYPVCMREVYKAAMKEFNDEELGIIKLKNPWTNVSIPKSDIPEKRAITASMLRKFFNVVPDRSRFTNPLMEVGQDVALISFCMCGLNAVDIFNAKKDQYVNGVFHYERQKTRMSRSDKGYFEIRVPEFLKPTFEKYLSRKVGSLWLFNFHD